MSYTAGDRLDYEEAALEASVARAWANCGPSVLVDLVGRFPVDLHWKVTWPVGGGCGPVAISLRIDGPTAYQLKPRSNSLGFVDCAALRNRSGQ